MVNNVLIFRSSGFHVSCRTPDSFTSSTASSPPSRCEIMTSMFVFAWATVSSIVRLSASFKPSDIFSSNKMSNDTVLLSVVFDLRARCASKCGTIRIERADDVDRVYSLPPSAIIASIFSSNLPRYLSRRESRLRAYRWSFSVEPSLA